MVNQLLGQSFLLEALDCQRATHACRFVLGMSKKPRLNMENHDPAIPDYLVKNEPGWEPRGEDTQLQKAVDVLQEEIK